ncbi:dTDP-4-dehydrorhamnose 3,5-epimerase-like enzyme [Microbacterium sp. SORGH_AS 888]|nr:dTDP-4-dehydrorhamnose 3,5-epimerase-like enzyme [Microbacterium sp. SORGH_AS_0888]
MVVTEYGKALGVTQTPIPGLVVFDLPVHGDSRGWFKENWQREKMIPAGLPDFGPVQNNISFNDATGTTRGIHAEPWDKYVSVATGRIFGAWVDLREGPTFGAVYTTELDPSRAIYVPRGVGNSYQTLEPDTAYTYLVNDHWSPTAAYSFLNLADETTNIPWPIPLDQAQISDKDKNHPRLEDVTPIPPKKILVTGANGQLGRALQHELGTHPWIEYTTRETLDLTHPDLATARRWRDYATIINAAAYTAVDTAETPQGRQDAWAANATAAATLARIATAHGITLVHISSDYVYDGTKPDEYTETDPVSPLGVYGPNQSRRRHHHHHRPKPLHPPHQLGHRRRQQLRPHHGKPRKPRHQPHRRQRPNRTPHLHPHHRRSHPPPPHHPRPPRHLQHHQHRPTHHLVRHRPHRLPPHRTRPQPRHPHHHHRLLRKHHHTHRPPTHQQPAQHHQNHQHRIHTPSLAGLALALSVQLIEARSSSLCAG